MVTRRLAVWLASVLLIGSGAAVASPAQIGRPLLTDCAAIPTPCVDKVDPPNWWVDMPSPMLLLHGNRLDRAKFAVSGNGVSLEKSKVSANGHYAFLWLEDGKAMAQEIRITISARSRSTAVPFRLQQRGLAGHGGFSSADTMYLIMTDRFADGDTANDPQPSERNVLRGWHGGDFRGIEQHLDYLQQLGITTVWTTPAYDNSGSSQSYHGYGTTDMYAVDPHFGTPDNYRHLAAALHARGMKLVLDTVPNHVGASHPWAEDSPMSDWFHGTLAHHSRAKGDFKSLPDPHAAWQESRDVTEGWFANVLPDLNQENPLVETYLIQNAVWWVESFDLDGLRLDTFPYVGRAFWRDFHAELHSLYPRLTTVGEVFNSDPTITSYFAGGVAQNGVDTGLDTPFDFPVYFAIRDVLLKGAPMSELPQMLRQDRLYPHPDRLVTFLGNHDTMRFLSEPDATPAKLKMAFALLGTLRGMPQLYAGDEVAMTGGNDPDNRHDFPGGFPGDTSNAFTAGGRSADQQVMYSSVAAVLHFRAAHSALQTGEQQDLFADDSTFAFLRTADIHSGCAAGHTDDRLLIVANRAEQPKQLALALKNTALEGCTQFQDALQTQPTVRASGSSVQLVVPSQTVAIYQVW